MTNDTIVWFQTLTDGVHALGAAAREYWAANEAARVASWHVDPARLLPVDGSLHVLGRDFVRPHDDALLKLGDLYSDLRSSAQGLYENASLAYAYGAISAVRSVVAGERPPYVELGRRDGRYELPKGSLPEMNRALGQWAGAEKLAGLRERVIERERARALVSDFEFYEDLSECDSPELTAASACAAGLAESAYAYGEAAQAALHFALVTRGAAGSLAHRP
ncbi:hypothetical protein [Streptomyces sp. 4R-3d]|uniref:hypothetical protein n=1 Tax=Streptomyces sp. 4R-3d TaxID=2559605 RepID=UPI001071759E|nr:hypothetical protein [Streptomyces sp. 4R-3d]TFI30687.1 hypothetical protein E4P36_02725 [Streptomyces sp. 4R-3d]